VAIRTLHMPIGSISSQSSHCPRNPGSGWKVLSPQGSHGVSGSARPGQSINQASEVSAHGMREERAQKMRHAHQSASKEQSLAHRDPNR
jgi:hypothetical protein